MNPYKLCWEAPTFSKSNTANEKAKKYFLRLWILTKHVDRHLHFENHHSKLKGQAIFLKIMIPYKTCLQAPVFPKSTQAMKRPRRIFQDYESLPNMLTGTQWCVRPFIGVLSVIAHCALRSSSSLFLQSCTVPNHRHKSEEHDKLPPAKPVVKVIKKGICTKGDNWIFSLSVLRHTVKSAWQKQFFLSICPEIIIM